MNSYPALCSFRLADSPLALFWRCDDAESELKIASTREDGTDELIAVLPPNRNWALAPLPQGECWQLSWSTGTRAGRIIAITDAQSELGWLEYALSFRLNGTAPNWHEESVEIPQGAAALRIGGRPKGDKWEWSAPTLETEAAGKQGIRVFFEFEKDNHLLEEDALDIVGRLRVNITAGLLLQPSQLWLLRLNSQDIQPTAVKVYEVLSGSESAVCSLDDSGAELVLEVSRGEEHPSKYRPRRAAVDERDVFVVKALPDGLVTASLAGTGQVDAVEYCGGRLLPVSQDNPVLRSMDEFWTEKTAAFAGLDGESDYKNLPAKVRAFLLEHPQQFQGTATRDTNDLLPLTEVVKAFFNSPKAADVLMGLPLAVVRFWLDEARYLSVLPDPAVIKRCVDNPGLLHAMVDFPALAPMLRTLNKQSIPSPFTLQKLLHQILGEPTKIATEIGNLPSARAELCLQWLCERQVDAEGLTYCITVGINPQVADDVQKCCEEARRLHAALDGSEHGADKSDLLQEIEAKAHGPFRDIETLRQLAHAARQERERIEAEHTRELAEEERRVENERVAARAGVRIQLEKGLLDFATELFPNAAGGAGGGDVILARANDALSKLPPPKKRDIDGEATLTRRVQKWESDANQCELGGGTAMWLAALRRKVPEIAAMGQNGAQCKVADDAINHYYETQNTLLPARRSILSPLLTELAGLAIDDPEGKLGPKLVEFQKEYKAALAENDAIKAAAGELNTTLIECGWKPITIGADIPKFALDSEMQLAERVETLSAGVRDQSSRAAALSDFASALNETLPPAPEIGSTQDAVEASLVERLSALAAQIRAYLSLRQHVENARATLRPVMEARFGTDRPDALSAFENGDLEPARRLIECEPLVRKLGEFYREIFEQDFPSDWLSVEPPLLALHWSDAHKQIFEAFRAFHTARISAPDAQAPLETLREREEKIRGLRDREEEAQDGGRNLRSLVHAEFRIRCAAAASRLPDTPEARVLRETVPDLWTVRQLEDAEILFSKP